LPDASLENPVFEYFPLVLGILSAIPGWHVMQDVPQYGFPILHQGFPCLLAGIAKIQPSGCLLPPRAFNGYNSTGFPYFVLLDRGKDHE
jgi:hypothetical protein